MVKAVWTQTWNWALVAGWLSNCWVVLSSWFFGHCLCGLVPHNCRKNKLRSIQVALTWRVPRHLSIYCSAGLVFVLVFHSFADRSSKHGAQKPWGLLGTGRRGGGGVWRWGEEGETVHYRDTVTTRMTHALRWAAMRAILMFHKLWGTKSQDSVHRSQLLKRTEADSNRGPSAY